MNALSVDSDSGHQTRSLPHNRAAPQAMRRHEQAVLHTVWMHPPGT